MKQLGDKIRYGGWDQAHVETDKVSIRPFVSSPILGVRDRVWRVLSIQVRDPTELLMVEEIQQ